MSRVYLRIILDALFPPTAHERLLRTVTAEQFVTLYLPTAHYNCIALAPYSSRRIQAAVAACKFEKNHHAATLLAALFAYWLETHTLVGTTILIPIPLSHARERERGFNQVTRVLEHLPCHEHIEIAKHWLIRPQDTARQTSLGRQARLKNMNDAFVMTPRLTTVDWTPISRIIICDDVMTTGSTLGAARAALEKVVPKHVQILCLAWAH